MAESNVADGLGYPSVPSAEPTTAKEKDTKSSEAETLEQLFAEFDAIDARIVQYQRESKQIGEETREILAELGNIIERL